MGILDLFRPNLTKLEERKDVVKLLRIFLKGKGWPKKASWRACRDSAIAIEALVRIGEASVVPLVDFLGRDSGPDIDTQIIDALGGLRDSRAVRPLIASWERTGRDRFYLDRIGHALERIGGEEALKSDLYLRYAEHQRLKDKQEKERERRKHAVKRITVLVNKRPVQDETEFVDQLLSTLKVHGNTYTAHLTKETAIHVFEAGDLASMRQ